MASPSREPAMSMVTLSPVWAGRSTDSSLAKLSRRRSMRSSISAGSTSGDGMVTRSES